MTATRQVLVTFVSRLKFMSQLTRRGAHLLIVSAEHVDRLPF